MGSNIFDSLAAEYEEWIIENHILFQSELLALKKVIPDGMKGIEIGIGNGIFAGQLGIQNGIDPSEKMLEYARRRGLDVKKGVAEDLPFKDEIFDFAVFITTLCYINDPDKAMKEAYRVLKPGGKIIIAIIDKESEFGKFLDKGKAKTIFYKEARFFSVPEVSDLLTKNDFMPGDIYQTLENPATNKIDEPVEGFGTGSFVVISGLKAK